MASQEWPEYIPTQYRINILDTLDILLQYFNVSSHLAPTVFVLVRVLTCAAGPDAVALGMPTAARLCDKPALLGASLPGVATTTS